MNRILPLVMLAMMGSAAARDAIDLSGEWRFALDPRDLGDRAKPEDWRFPDKIRLPGIVTAQGFGETPSIRTQWTGDGWRYPDLFKEWQADDNFKFPFFLQPPKHYVGAAWYQRDFEWPGGQALLHLERVHWQSTVWVDGREAGGSDSLGTPHEFHLGALKKGKHTLTLRIDNRLAPVNVGPLSHSVTDHTQGNWNGVVGRMEMREISAGRIASVQVHPSLDGGLKVVVNGTVDAIVREAGIRIEVDSARDPGKFTDVKSEVVARDATGAFRVERTCEVGQPKLWSEFEPNVYTARVMLSCGDDMPADQKSVTFGFRQVGTKDGRITINGRKTFLRGTLECCIFPITGHPPTDVASWKRIVSICKAHGLNHIRFHSWCPPEAAFVAADELGFYYQVEVSSWANQGAEIGGGGPLDAWLEAESKRMLAAYGNHPSFLLMAYGNEPAGRNHPQWLQQWVARRKAEDPRRLYTTAAGWPMMPGSDYHNTPQPRLQAWGQGLKSIINGQAPRTDFDWSDYVAKHADVPIISHEIGQWCVYPNFAEIAKYTGYFKARNFEIFRETARRNGLLDQAPDLLRASGKLQALAYKHDIEAALRTPGFGGFQLLDLHDFPGQGTALVGVLDAFWEEKGYISPAEFGRFSGPVVPLARLEKMIFTTAENLAAELELAQFGPADIKQAVPAWSLAAADGTVVAAGKLPPRDLASGELHRLGRVEIPLAKVTAPAKLTLSVGIEGRDALNAWDVFVYQANRTPAGQAEGVLITPDLEQAKEALARGGRVLWMPHPRAVRDDPARPLVAGFSPIFWNTAWTNWQPPHTLGILCDPKHPALAGFPTDGHSNWQWWEIQQIARPFMLTQHRKLRPIVQVIDDWVTNRKLGYVFEARVGEGKLIAFGADPKHSACGPAARELVGSLVEYMTSDKFAPATALAPDELDGLARPLCALGRLGGRAAASSAEPGHEAALAVDGDPATLWHTEYSKKIPQPPHELTLTMGKTSALEGGTRLGALLLTQRQDHNANGQVAEAEILLDRKVVAKVRLPKNAVSYRIPLPADTRASELTIRVLKSHAGPFACLAEVEIETPNDHEKR